VGARHVQGDLVVFTDDDIMPDSDWLRAFECAADANPTAGLFGGVILPTLIDQAGEWFEASANHHAELYAKSEHAEGQVNAAAHIYGPNFMMRSEHLGVLDEVTAALGPMRSGAGAKSFPMGEDTQIMELLQTRGVVAHYAAGALVKHLVRGFQTDLAFMLARAERHGRGFAIRRVDQAGRGFARRLARRARLAAEHFVKWRALSAGVTPTDLKPESAVFDRLWAAQWSNGVWRGALEAT
jgi:hypothetical protein